MTGLAPQAARMIGAALSHSHQLAGGDLSRVEFLELMDGRQAVVKTGPAPMVEAGMLAALAEAGAPVPQVLAVDDRLLVLSHVPHAGGPGSAWEDLGRVLAGLHRTSGARYGWAHDYAFGPIPIRNTWCDDWVEFFATHRLMPHHQDLPVPVAVKVEQLARKLGDRLPKHPKASLLHGDCWGGNILAQRDRVAALIDPACCYGDAEVDLAMLGLFDRPAEIFDEAYGGLETGYSARRPIYQLWPALVHLRLFGGTYRRLVENLLAACGV